MLDRTRASSLIEAASVLRTAVLHGPKQMPAELLGAVKAGDEQVCTANQRKLGFLSRSMKYVVQQLSAEAGHAHAQAVRALTSLGEKYPQAELTACLIAAAENGHASMCSLLLVSYMLLPTACCALQCVSVCTSVRNDPKPWCKMLFRKSCAGYLTKRADPD